MSLQKKKIYTVYVVCFSEPWFPDHTQTDFGDSSLKTVAPKVCESTCKQAGLFNVFFCCAFVFNLSDCSRDSFLHHNYVYIMSQQRALFFKPCPFNNLNQNTLMYLTFY